MARSPPDPYFVLRSHSSAITALCFMVEEEQKNGGQDSLPSYATDPCLLSGSGTGEIFMWNLKINRVVYEFQQLDKKMILWLHYFRRRILSQIREGGIKIWSYTGDEWIVTGAVPVGEIGFCSSALISTYSSTYIIIPGPQTSCVSTVNFDTCETTAVLEPEISPGMCMCINSFMLNGRLYVFCGYENGSIILWDCVNGSTTSRLSYHSEPVMCLDFDQNHKHSGISGSTDDHLLVWKLDDKFNLLVKKKIKLTNPGVASTCIRPDGKIVIVGCWDSSVHVFSWKTLKPLAVLQFHSGTINCLNFSPISVCKHKNVFAAGSKDQNISLWYLY